jgi:hypothetical protein
MEEFVTLNRIYEPSAGHLELKDLVVLLRVSGITFGSATSPELTFCFFAGGFSGPTGFSVRFTSKVVLFLEGDNWSTTFNSSSELSGDVISLSSSTLRFCARPYTLLTRGGEYAKKFSIGTVHNAVLGDLFWKRANFPRLFSAVPLKVIERKSALDLNHDRFDPHQ